MKRDIPSQYVLLLQCCYSSDCKHPLCKGAPENLSWFPGGPTFSFQNRIPHSSGAALIARNALVRHVMAMFLMPEAAFESASPAMVKPPSQLSKKLSIY